MFARHRHNNKPHPGRFVFITLGILFLAILIAGQTLKYTHHSPTQNESLDAVLTRIQHRGGILAECREGVCRNVRTHEKLGTNDREGFYVVHPEGSVSQAELEQESQAVASAMAREEAQK